MKNVVILGSTGSIGTQTLAVLSQFPDRFRVVGLVAGKQVELLAQQIAQFQPEIVAVASAEGATALKDLLTAKKRIHKPNILVGTEGLTVLATWPQAETIVVGLVGFTGLSPTLQALKTGKQVLTANKETFVTAGHLVTPYLSQIVPLDSEHSAIFQCLQGAKDRQREVHKLFLTASGGPFWEYTPEALEHVTITDALKHPNWQMGTKVTIDSATMMNKGLECIEAHHLFGMPFAQIEVVIHPQSIVHSAVAYRDGAMIAQLGVPDMRVPLQYGLTYPERLKTSFEELHLDLATLGTLQFMPPDVTRFPCLELAHQAGIMGGTMPVVLNAADELAVAAFLQEKITFQEIPRHIEQLLQAHQNQWTANPSLEEIIATDSETRERYSQKFFMQAV